MNRRTILKSLIALAVVKRPAKAYAADNWVILGKRCLRPNTQSITFALKNEIAGIAKLGIEVKGNSLWLYDFRVASQGGAENIQLVNLNIPASSGECAPRVGAQQICASPREVQLRFECLPLTGKPTEILLWGSA